MNNVLDEMYLTHIYRTFHPKEAKYTFSSNPYGTFSKIDYMVEQNEPQQIQENWNHIKHFLREQEPETRNHPQGENSKTLIFKETE